MKTIILILAVIVAKFALADSPLTSTSLHVGYEDNEHVKSALKNKTLTKAQLNFFISDAVLPEKIAVVSAFGWGNEGLDLVKKMSEGLIKARGGENKLTADDNYVLAYAQALEDYFDVSKTQKYFDKVNLEEETRESALWVFNLCVMQVMLDDMSQWCTIYQRGEALKSLPGLNRDMKESTLKEGIYSYIDIYQGTCTEE